MDLRAYLNLPGVTATALARKLDVSHSTVLRWADQSVALDMRRASEVVAASGGQVTVDDLMASAVVRQEPEAAGEQRMADSASEGMAHAHPPSRTKTIAWDDPAPTLAVLGRIPGRDFLQGMIEGRYPRAPFGALVGLDGMEVGDGTCRVSLTPSECHNNPMGSMHGGILATLLDTALGCALQTQLDVGEGHTTATLETKYVRPVNQATGRITAEARVVHRGRTLAIAEGRVTDAGGKLYATATSTLAVFRAAPLA